LRRKLRKKTFPQNLNNIGMKNSLKILKIKKQRRANRTRAKILGTIERPRLSVFRSNQHIYGQLINDEKSITLASASDLELKKSGKKTKIELAKEVGMLLAKKAADLKIKKVVFDKGGYRYHGIVKSLAEGAREGGLNF